MTKTPLTILLTYEVLIRTPNGDTRSVATFTVDKPIQVVLGIAERDEETSGD